ncbi:hypothetical protein, partial [Bosea thiooxidans]
SGVDAVAVKAIAWLRARSENISYKATVRDIDEAIAAVSLSPAATSGSEAGGEMRAQITPFSSVVGQSVLLTDETGAALAQLSISIPDPNKPYRETAEEIARVIELAINQPPSEEVKRLRVRLGDLMIEDAKRMAALAKPASSPAGGDVDDLRRSLDQLISYCKPVSEAHVQRVSKCIDRICALSPPTSAAEPVAWIANCCHCGRIVDTREEKEGGDKFGCELTDGRWTCSPECWDAVVEPDATPPAPAAVDGQRVKAPLDAEDEMDPAGRIRACLATDKEGGDV